MQYVVHGIMLKSCTFGSSNEKTARKRSDLENKFFGSES